MSINFLQRMNAGSMRFKRTRTGTWVLHLYMVYMPRRKTVCRCLFYCQLSSRWFITMSVHTAWNPDHTQTMLSLSSSFLHLWFDISCVSAVFVDPLMSRHTREKRVDIAHAWQVACSTVAIQKLQVKPSAKECSDLEHSQKRKRIKRHNTRIAALAEWNQHNHSCICQNQPTA